MRSTKFFIGLLAAFALSISVAACGDKFRETNAPVGAAPSSPTAPRPSGEASSTDGRAQAIVVKGEGALVRSYGLPTLQQFVADSFVTNIVEGDVAGVQPVVSSDENTVSTLVTLKVSRDAGEPKATTVQFLEAGGIVPLRAVRSQFEGKDGQTPLTEADLTRMVDFRVEGTPHSLVGQHVIALLAGQPSAGVYGLAAKLVKAVEGGSYAWAEGDAPNPDWARNLSLSQVQALFNAKPWVG